MLHDISYHVYFGKLNANTEYKIGKRLTAIRTANSTAPEANTFSIHVRADTQPTISFTKLEIELVQ